MSTKPVFTVTEKVAAQGGISGNRHSYRETRVRLTTLEGDKSLITGVGDFELVFRDERADEADEFVLGDRYVLVQA